MQVDGAFVNCGHLFFILLLLPHLKIWEHNNCRYWLPTCHVKFLRDKKWSISFYFTLSKRGILVCKSMETGKIEGIITSIIGIIIKHILTCNKNSTIYFKWNLHSLKNDWFGTFCESLKSGSSLDFKMSHTIVHETKVMALSGPGITEQREYFLKPGT